MADNSKALKAANSASKYKAPAANVLERKAVQNVAKKIQANVRPGQATNVLRKDQMATAASIVQKEGPSVTKEAGKGPGPAERYQQGSEVMKTSGLKGREVGKMDHQGGHGLQGGAISAFGGGGLTVKTPVAPKTNTTTKTPVKPNISLKNK